MELAIKLLFLLTGGVLALRGAFGLIGPAYGYLRCVTHGGQLDLSLLGYVYFLAPSGE
jgi:hypothetical protein